MNHLKSLWHTFFIQMFWNYHTMASVGACYLLDKLLYDRDIPRSIRLRLIIFFNGNPYLIPYAISAVAKEIKDETDENKIMKFIDSVVGFLGAVGDQYYWNSLKPLVVLMPMLAIFLKLDTMLIIWIAVFAFLIFNVKTLSERSRGLKLGAEHGFSVVKDVKQIKNRWGNLHFSKISFFAILLFLLTSFSYTYSDTNLLIAACVGLAWGSISGKRGNSQKYLFMAVVSYVLLELVL